MSDIHLDFFFCHLRLRQLFILQFPWKTSGGSYFQDVDSTWGVLHLGGSCGDDLGILDEGEEAEEPSQVGMDGKVAAIHVGLERIKPMVFDGF